MPPEHGNWGKNSKVYRWAYDYSVPGSKEDFIPQNVPPSEVVEAKVEKREQIKKYFFIIV